MTLGTCYYTKLFLDGPLEGLTYECSHNALTEGEAHYFFPTGKEGNDWGTNTAWRIVAMRWQRNSAPQEIGND